MNAVQRRLRGLAVVVAVGATVTGVGCSSGGDGPPEVAATVGKVKVAASDTEGLVDAFLGRQAAQQQEGRMPREEVTKLVLDYQIKLAFLDHLAAETGVSAGSEVAYTEAADAVNPAAHGLMGQRRNDFARQLRAGRLSKELAAKVYPQVEVPEQVLRDEYERRSPLLDRHWKATAEVARFKTEGPAQELRGRSQRGESFAQAASALGAEAVGTVDINPLVATLAPAVLDVVGRLPAGEVSEAIPVEGGFLAVRVEDRQDTPRLSFEDVRAELADQLAERQRFGLFQQWFEQQFTRARVTVDGYYGDWDPKLAKVI